MSDPKRILTSSLRESCTVPKKSLNADILVRLSMIDKALAAFLQEGVGIHIGTRNAALEPNGARALAVQRRRRRRGTSWSIVAEGRGGARSSPDSRPTARSRSASARPVDDRAVPGERDVRRRARGATDAERRSSSAQWDGFLAQPRDDRHPARGDQRAGSTWPAVAIRLRVNAALQPDARARRGSADRMSRARSSRSRPASRASCRRSSSRARSTAFPTPRT